MNALSSAGPSRYGFGAFGMSVGLALIAGALALEIPSLAALVGTLAALALAGWAAGARGRTARSGRGRWSVAGAFVLLGVAALFFVSAPPALAETRGLALALGLLPLWLVERRRTSFSTGGTTT